MQLGRWKILRGVELTGLLGIRATTGFLSRRTRVNLKKDKNYTKTISVLMTSDLLTEP